VNVDFLYGLLQLGPWGYALSGLVLLQITVMAVTLYLHRDAAHRSVDLHPLLRHVFRFWIWATSGQITREWVAVHRKHHAFADRAGDPHSPVVYGIRKVLLEGYELYHPESRNSETQAKFGADTVNDWVERNFYSRYRNLGITLLILAYLALFGVPGIILIAVQLAAMLAGPPPQTMTRQEDFVRSFVRPRGLDVSATSAMADALETLAEKGPVETHRPASMTGRIGFAALRALDRVPVGRRLLLDEREMNSKKRRADDEQARGAAGIA